MEENAKWRQVEKALELIRPYIQGDGGDVELVEIDDNNIVTVRLVGNCVGCDSSEITLQEGIESTVMAQLPWVRDVRSTDSTEGVAMPKSAGATGQLSNLMRSIEESMKKFEFELLSSADADSLPVVAFEWEDWIRGEFGRLCGALETCVFPMAEVFLPSVIEASESIRRIAERFEPQLNEYSEALVAAKRGGELFSLFQSAQQVLRTLNSFFLRCEGVLFAMLDEMLPEELRSEARTDISNYMRRVFQNKSATNALVHNG